MTASAAWTKAWQDVLSLRPIVEAARDEADDLRRLPDSIGRAFVARDIYRLMLPADLGGAGLDPLQIFDLTLEVSRYDASTGWNYSIATGAGLLAGVLSPDEARAIFETPDCSGAASGPPQGRAVATEGGYRVSGRWSWASGIHQARRVSGGCFVFDGDKPRMAPTGGPVVVHVLVPIEEAVVLDTWRTGGMRGTGSTDFVLDDVFVPEARVFRMFGGAPTLPHPVFKLPTTFFGFGLTAVPLGTALSTIEALKALARSKKLPPPRTSLAEQPGMQRAVAKAEAMVEAAILAVREAFLRVWTEICTEGAANLESRARVRRSSVHAVETAIEAVDICYREAGGSALFEDAPFERALRDVHAVGGHVVFQRAMMEDAGRVALGLAPLLPMF
jgi:alkylation response protein AidB-like acyl-CoA dehydrogenase